MLSCALFIFLAGPPSWVPAKTSDVTRLTLDRIFASPDFRPERSRALKWLDTGDYLMLQPSQTLKNGNDIVQFDKAGNSKIVVHAELLVPHGTKQPLDIHGYEWSPDRDLWLIYTNSARVWRLNTRGDYWLLRRSTGRLVKLGSDARPSTLMFAKLSPDGTKVGYVRDNQLYVQPVNGDAPTKITSDGTAEVINGTFDWVYEEEFSCHDGWRWSPDSKQIAYWQIDTRGVKTFTLVDNTSGTYPTLKTFAYPKTGERNSLCRIGVVSASGGSTKWLNIPGDTRTDYYIPRMDWAANAREIAIQRINRLQNSLDVILADTNNGKIRSILTERDGSWVDVHDDAGQWINRGQQITWISERDGWRHLYLASRDGRNFHRVTGGDFDIIRVVRVAEKAGFVYFLASPDEPTRQYLYRAALNGNGKAERLTPAAQPGWHDYNIAPDGMSAVHTVSTFGTPPTIELIELPTHRTIRTLAKNDRLRETVSKLDKTAVEFFRVDIGGGTMLDGWLMKPPGFNPARKYPLFFYVYGEPAGQTVTDRWAGNRYLWHLMLAQQGYVVACIDNRGTPCPRGRDWRKSAYRQIGTLASHDQAAACRALLKRPYLDSQRVGVWGWSGGGSMTLNLLFRHPDLYRVGMSVAPVPDMRLYDTIYQERYMGLPSDNAEDYKRGSPLTHAAGLKGRLLLVHGSGDDNCHYQGTELLTNRLVELNKPFTLMTYPNRSHSVDEGANTTRHLYSLLTRYINEHLPVSVTNGRGKELP